MTNSPVNIFRINLALWDELAHVAIQHVEKGHQIYVSGRLISDTVESEDGKQQTYYKVFPCYDKFWMQCPHITCIYVYSFVL